jgi:hypothetical protein
MMRLSKFALTKGATAIANGDTQVAHLEFENGDLWVVGRLFRRPSGELKLRFHPEFDARGEVYRHMSIAASKFYHLAVNEGVDSLRQVEVVA